jgi:hypothetical protein
VGRSTRHTTKQQSPRVSAPTPQPHPGVIEVFGAAALYCGDGEVEGAGEDGPVRTATLLDASIWDTRNQLVAYAGEAKPLATDRYLS